MMSVDALHGDRAGSGGQRLEHATRWPGPRLLSLVGLPAMRGVQARTSGSRASITAVTSSASSPITRTCATVRLPVIGPFGRSR